jgi:nucleoside 2-deoxyribosyltransferase
VKLLAPTVVFTSIHTDFPTARGTIAEIGYAAALKKPIYTARSPEAAALNLIELWFPLSMRRFIVTYENPRRASRLMAAVILFTCKLS